MMLIKTIAQRNSAPVVQFFFVTTKFAWLHSMILIIAITQRYGFVSS